MPELITIEELQTRIGDRELRQIAGNGSFHSEAGRSLDEPRITAAIGYATDFIKSFLSVRYPSLFTDENGEEAELVPGLIKGYASDIVRYRLRLQSDDQNQVSEEVENRYKQACDWLKMAASGKVNLDLDDGESAGSAVPLMGQVLVAEGEDHAPDMLRGYN